MLINKWLCLLLLPATLISETVFAENTLVIDAGSSGSRLYDYKYHYDNSGSDEGLPIFDSNSSLSISGGIQNVNLKNLDTYLTELFVEVTTEPDNINFYSTAGMRLVSPSKREIINNEVKEWIENHYPSSHVSVKTITGKVEGAYAWLASNYLNDSLKNKRQTTGVMDLGGASTQITFEQSSDDSMVVPVNENTYYLSSYSFLGLGQDQAIVQYLNESSCFPKGFLLPNGKLGTGNFTKCTKKVKSLVNNTHFINHLVNTADTKNDFYAIAGFYYTAKTLGITDNYSLTKLSKEGQDFCSTNWDQLKNKSPEYQKDKYLYTECFNAAYEHALISKGYKLSEDNNILTINKINGQSISWTLGAIISPTL
ncbi:hypothetical protein HQQ94_20030 [Shewanella sp. VB17]|uniref:hypothetical protein n=1 Tax=Shewanella sp. VB17 TaxID=2739432 RepID=UPI001565DCAF|nr:hypothetical protein [Shewanella sp. VB17]NRD75465.1 hypothetical protein [Shewanella sp. VB17]